MVQVEESRLAELIKKAHKFEWLNQLNVEDLFDENGISVEESIYNEYYKYDDMSDEKVIEDYLHIVQ